MSKFNKPSKLFVDTKNSHHTLKSTDANALVCSRNITYHFSCNFPDDFDVSLVLKGPLDPSKAWVTVLDFTQPQKSPCVVEHGKGEGEEEEEAEEGFECKFGQRLPGTHMFQINVVQMDKVLPETQCIFYIQLEVSGSKATDLKSSICTRLSELELEYKEFSNETTSSDTPPSETADLPASLTLPSGLKVEDNEVIYDETRLRPGSPSWVKKIRKQMPLVKKGLD